MSRLAAILRKHAPKSLLKSAAILRNYGLDAADLLLDRRRDLVPPRRLSFIGGGDFLAIGREFLGHFRDLGGLRPHHDVLDVGSGIGRMAVPLTGYLSGDGSYEGMDVVPHGINWCQQHITPRFPNFQFRLADVRNKAYNPKGQVPAADFDFPFPAESFDFAFLTSVFTHMLPDEVDNYLSEVQRVLRPGGQCLITWFLLNTESETLLHERKSVIDFPHQLPGCRVANLSVPEDAVAYGESDVVAAYRNYGLKLNTPIHYGSWCGRPAHVSFQDICVARKRAMSGEQI